MQDLGTRLKAIADSYPFTTRWCLKDLHGGGQIDHDGDVVMPSASVRKIAILMAALAAVRAGKAALQDGMFLAARLREDAGSGTYQYMTLDREIPLRDALVNMIITSDNVCTQAVLEHIGPDTMTGYCRSIGMKNTDHRGLIPRTNKLEWDHPAESVATTTQTDQVLLLDLILRGTQDAATADRLGCTPELCRLAIDILSWQLLRNLIPSLLPQGTKVAHKTGRGRRGRMDAGIVFSGGAPRFILAVATDWVPDTMPDGMPGFAASFASVGRIANACWNEFTRPVT